jgi:hypothetical protein
MVDDRVWRSVRLRGASIVLVITGNSIRAGRLARAVFRRGINVRLILYPAVPERAARSRIAHFGLWEVSPKCPGLSDHRLPCLTAGSLAAAPCASLRATKPRVARSLSQRERRGNLAPHGARAAAVPDTPPQPHGKSPKKRISAANGELRAR